MKNVKIILLSCILALSVVVSSCKKDEAKILTEYVESVITPANLPAYITAADLHSANLLGQVYVIDVRGAADYDAGHIEKAVNVELKDLPDYMANNDLTGYDKVVLACKTGQSAAWGCSMLRMLGYTNVYSLKFGMSSWSPDFDSWTSNIGNIYFTQFETTANEKAAPGDLPIISTGFTDGKDILDAQVNNVFAEGFEGSAVTASTVFSNLGDYYIINYWPEDHYLSPGHIPGAVDYVPGESLTLKTDLRTLPTDKPIAVYCYTGQTSAFITAYLRVLGYNAKSIKFGANCMIYDNLPSSKWVTLQEGYNYVTTE